MTTKSQAAAALAEAARQLCAMPKEPSIWDLISDVRAALAAYDAADSEGWQPIETAPRDGTPVLGYRRYPAGDLPEFFAVTWFAPSLGKRKCWLIYDGKYKGGDIGPFFSWEPVFWRPLPPPPADGGEG